MDFKKECPYCHSAVSHIIYTNDRDREYCFFCNCTKGTLMRNDHMAYQSYLEERELNNMTNYDKYFDNGYTYSEFEKNIDNWCKENSNLDCRECPYGRTGQVIVQDFENGNCADLFAFLEKRIN